MDSAPGSISETESCLTLSGDLHNPNDSEDDMEADYESAIELDYCIEGPESLE